MATTSRWNGHPVLRLSIVNSVTTEHDINVRIQKEWA